MCLSTYTGFNLKAQHYRGEPEHLLHVDRLPLILFSMLGRLSGNSVLAIGTFPSNKATYNYVSLATIKITSNSTISFLTSVQPRHKHPEGMQGGRERKKEGRREGKRKRDGERKGERGKRVIDKS